MLDGIIFEPLAEYHDRAAFTCSGEEGAILQDYLRNDARGPREHRKHVTTLHVMVQESAPSLICGYFTLSSASLRIEELPKNIAKGLPKYRTMPAIRLGRMAIDDRFRGHDLGTLLIQEAFNIAVRLKDSVGFVAMLVDAKTDNLVNYYEQRGFTRLPEAERTLFIMQPTMEQILSAS
ncbi:MAG TPA: GNAT family N-acetyltransferase [Candidatus Baltobacteraceae bacterium]